MVNITSDISRSLFIKKSLKSLFGILSLVETKQVFARTSLGIVNA